MRAAFAAGSASMKGGSSSQRTSVGTESRRTRLSGAPLKEEKERLELALDHDISASSALTHDDLKVKPEELFWKNR